MSRAVILEVKLPPGVSPSHDSTEQLIRKFLKECSKESLVQFIHEKSAWTRRFEKRSDVERLRKLKYKQTAKKNNRELSQDIEETVKKKKKKAQKHHKQDTDTQQK
jgi:hypothetical protein